MTKSIQRRELAHTRNAFVRLLRLPGVREIVIAVLTAAVTAVGTYSIAASQLELDERRVNIERDNATVAAWRDLIGPLRDELERATARIDALRSDKHELSQKLDAVRRELDELRRECAPPFPPDDRRPERIPTLPPNPLRRAP